MTTSHAGLSSSSWVRTEADEATTSLHGLSLSSWVQTEADKPTTSLCGLPSSLCVTQGRGSSDEPTWLIVCTAVIVSPKDPTPARSRMRGGGVGVNVANNHVEGWGRHC